MYNLKDEKWTSGDFVNLNRVNENSCYVPLDYSIINKETPPEFSVISTGGYDSERKLPLSEVFGIDIYNNKLANITVAISNLS